MTTAICNLSGYFYPQRPSGITVKPLLSYRRLAGSFIFLFTLLATGSMQASTAMTWNMEWFPSKTHADDAAAPGRIKAAQDVVKSISSDIMLFQEVNNWAAMQAVVDALPGYQVDMVTDFKGCRQQTAIVSRYPVDSAWYEPFADYESDSKAPPRGFAFAALVPSPGHYILCYSVHLKSNRGGEPEKNVRAREESARQLIKHVASMRTLYEKKGKVSVIIAGDFNTLQDDPKFAAEETLKLFLNDGYHWSWSAVPKEQRATWPGSGSYSSATFDHFFTKELPPSTVKIMGKTAASDHCPVILSW